MQDGGLWYAICTVTTNDNFTQFVETDAAQALHFQELR